MKEGTPGFTLSWEGSLVLSLALGLIVGDGVEYKISLNPLEGVPLNWPWDRLGGSCIDEDVVSVSTVTSIGHAEGGWRCMGFSGI